MNKNSTLPYWIGISLAVVCFLVLSAVAGIMSAINTPTKTPPPIAASETPSIPATYASATSTDSLTGRVIEIVDGDTLTIIDDLNATHKIRLAGIDAPETGQDFSKKSKQNLSDLVFGKTVSIIGDKIDKYGRRVGTVIMDGTDVGLEQIKKGLAWHFKKYESEQSETNRLDYATAEDTARDLKTNIWSMPNPMAPWDFRAGGSVDPELRDKIFGNKNSLLYHWSECPGFAKISAKNRVVFDTWEDAEFAGYNVAGNCPKEKPQPKADPALKADTYELRDDTIAADDEKDTPLPVYKETPLPSDKSGKSKAKSMARALCNDGSFSYESIPSRACTGNGGVSRWLYPSYSSTTPQPASPKTVTPQPTPYYVPSYPQYSPPSYPSSQRSVRPPDGAPKTVQVRGYYRKDGTYVRPHTRRAPRSKY